MKRRFNIFITTNPWLKLASFILAVMLWFFVVSKGRSVISMDVPLGFRNIPAHLEVVESPRTIGITLEGQERLLDKLKKEDINIIIDLSKIKEGKTFFPLSADNITLPKTLTLNKISPQRVRLMVEEKIKKDVTVRPVIVGSPARGFIIEGIVVTPRVIGIEGPKSVIERIYTAKTEPIDISGITNSLQYNAHLDIMKENVRINTHVVSVNISVGKSK